MKNSKRILPKRSGRDSRGHVSVRHQGGRQKRFLRPVDFKRNKHDTSAVVTSIEYDPNRTAYIAVMTYSDGEKGYILAPTGLTVGDKVESGENASPKEGNSLPLGKIPVGSIIHNLEITPGKGAQIVRSSQSSATIQGREGNFVLVKLPSGEIKKFVKNAYATVGQVGGSLKKRIGKAGRKRKMGIRPTVRGVAMHPAAHPHGGGEGRSGEGMSTPKTPWGKPARGVKTRRKRKYSNKLIVQKRKIGYGAKKI